MEGDAMNISMHFEGYVEKVIAEAVRTGIAKTKAEALRLGVLELNDKYQLVRNRMEQEELEEDLREIARIERDIKTGKEKVHRVKNISELSE